MSNEYMDEPWQDWTPCEMYGHEFDEDGSCRDCPERIADDLEVG